MNTRKLMFLALLWGSAECLAAGDMFGMASSSDDVVCVSFGKQHPQIGAPVKVVDPADQRVVLEGTLGAETDACQFLERKLVTGTGPYFLVMSKEKIPDQLLGIAVSGNGTMSEVEGNIQWQATGSAKKIFFRECASGEGIHFTTWGGQPLNGKPLWRQYYYVGFDLEPNCTDGDFVE